MAFEQQGCFSLHRLGRMVALDVHPQNRRSNRSFTSWGIFAPLLYEYSITRFYQIVNLYKDPTLHVWLKYNLTVLPLGVILYTRH